MSLVTCFSSVKAALDRNVNTAKMDFMAVLVFDSRNGFDFTHFFDLSQFFDDSVELGFSVGASFTLI